VCLTGASGFIGSNMKALLADHNIRQFAWDRHDLHELGISSYILLAELLKE
jgi:hypothetical protein